MTDQAQLLKSHPGTLRAGRASFSTTGIFTIPLLVPFSTQPTTKLMINIKKLIILAAAALLTIATNTQAQPDSKLKETAQAWFDAMAAGDVQKVKAMGSGKILQNFDHVECDAFRQAALKWGCLPVKLTVERVESEFGTGKAFFHDAFGRETELLLKQEQGVWKVLGYEGGGDDAYWHAARPDGEKAYKEGFPAKIAQTWLDAILAGDWEKAHSVCEEGQHEGNVEILKSLKKWKDDGRKIPKITLDYLSIPSKEYAKWAAVYFIIDGKQDQNFGVHLKFKNNVWTVSSVDKWYWMEF